MTTEKREASEWNIWWTVTLISAAFTILMLLLEGFGILHDWGFVLSGIGVVVTIVGSAQAATRTAVVTIDRRLSEFHDTQLHTLRVIEHTLRVIEQMYTLLDTRLPPAVR